MLTVAATVSAVIAFSATSALYGADLASERRTGNVGQLGFWTSAALTAVVAVAIGASEGLSALVRGGGLFATLALLTAGGFLAVRRAFKVRVAAALVAPVCGLMLLLSLVLPYQSATVEDAYQTLLLTHVGLALLGLGPSRSARCSRRSTSCRSASCDSASSGGSFSASRALRSSTRPRSGSSCSAL